MSSFAAWGLTILGLAVVTTVAEMLLPQGKTKKVIRSVTATVAVLVIVTPLPSLFKSGFNFDFEKDAVQIDDKYLEYTEKLKSELYCSAAKKYLAEKGYATDFEMSVTLDGWNVKSVTLNFSDFGMTDNAEHIHKSEIIKLVADYFGIGEEAIMSYG
ncbi:MAG: stage III sporulation protein AF [Clostridiales bacterium]|nr:stage III sporulation protein AF [Clostridiales bacterium]